MRSETVSPNVSGLLRFAITIVALSVVAIVGKEIYVQVKHHDTEALARDAFKGMEIVRSPKGPCFARLHARGMPPLIAVPCSDIKNDGR